MSNYYGAARAVDQWNNATTRAMRKGIGLAAYVEIAGWGPGPGDQRHRRARTSYSAAPPCAWTARGTVEVLAGASGHGQGHTTSWAQIAADQLGIDHSQVRVYEGDTAMIQTGTGTFASRSVSVDGAGVHIAAAEGARQDAQDRGAPA